MAINNLSNPFEIEEYNRRQKEQLLQLMTPGQKANAARGQMAMQSPRLDSNINMPLSAKQQLAIQATQNADIAGMDQILGAKTTTLGTALAKTLAAGASSYYGRKDNAEKASVLTKALQAQENAIGAKQRIADDIALQSRLTKDNNRAEDTAESLKRWEAGQAADKAKILAEQAQITADEEAEAAEFERKSKIPGKPFSAWDSKGKQVTLVRFPNGSFATPGEDGDLVPTSFYGLSLEKPKQDEEDLGGLTEKAFNDQRVKLGNTLAPAVQMQKSLQEAWGALAPFTNADDIPGIGRIEGGANFVGTVTRAIQSLGGSKATNVFATISGAINQMIRIRAGLTQSSSEMNRVLAELESNGFSGEEGVIKAMRRIDKAQIADMANIKSSFNPAVVENYINRYNPNETNPFDYAPSKLLFNSIGENPKQRLIDLQKEREGIKDKLAASKKP